MGHESILVSLSYLAFVLAVVAFERRRIRLSGADAITVFVVLLMLQCCISGIVIYALLPYAPGDAATGVYAFDRILRGTDIVIALLVLCLTVWFTMFFYAGCAAGRAVLVRLWPAVPHHTSMRVDVSGARLAIVLAFGLSLTLYSFYSMGDSWLGRYTQLVLYRAFEGEVERDALNANAFSLTQVWSWLSVIAIFCAVAVRRWRWLLPFCALSLVVFAILGVSRRAMFLPLLMIYLALVLYTRRWRFRWIAMAAVPLVLIVAFGKNALAAVAYGGTIEDVAGSYESWVSALLRAAADIGITVVESLGTLQFLDIGPRLGMDHLVSMAQMFPEKSLGIDFGFPERIVRISTEAFDDANAQDIPPGLLGQMWLDFGMLGPAVWGLLFGLQVSMVQFVFERAQRSRQSAAVFVVLTFVVALPLNTGSFDFTFSPDIVALAVALSWCVRVRRQSVLEVHVAPATHPFLAGTSAPRHVKAVR
jgi:hypothetical protein